MLAELLAVLAHSPVATGPQLRQRLGLSEASYQHLLGELVRLGYLRRRDDAEPSCPTGSCNACPMACAAPAPEALLLSLTERGRAFLARRGA